MAYGTGGNSLDQQCVVVAVSCDGDYLQGVSAGFTFHPDTVFRSAEECHFTGRFCFFVSFFVHKAQHQYLVCVVVLNDGGNQAAHFFKI